MTTTKLHGREFYESIGSPKHVLAPMVDQSEFAWRLLTRSFLPPDLRRSILTYSPMLHAKLFSEKPKYRNEHFKPIHLPVSSQSAANGEQEEVTAERQPFLDGHLEIDRPLFVQFCANDPQILLEAAEIVAPYCDAVDLNLGCPQGIAKKGGYGAFLQEDWPTIHNMISTLHQKLSIPVTAKMRILESKERTLEYAKMILGAGASILTVHGRQREQKGHNTGVADWSVIRYLRDNLPADTVIFANGNVLQHDDIQKCMEATGVDGVMSAEGNLYDPSIFDKAGKGGWRMDAILRRYLDIIYKHVLCIEPPTREPLWILSDPPNFEEDPEDDHDRPPPTKKQKRAAAKAKAKEHGKAERISDVNLAAMQSHMFNMLRPLVSKHTNVRDALACARLGEMDDFEKVLKLTERAVKRGMQDYEMDLKVVEPEDGEEVEDQDSSAAAVRRCKRPYFVCQPYVRPLPKEALANGALQLSKRERLKLKEEEEKAALDEVDTPAGEQEKSGLAKLGASKGHAGAQQEEMAQLAKQCGTSTGHVEEVSITEAGNKQNDPGYDNDVPAEKVEIPREGLVCG